MVVGSLGLQLVALANELRSESASVGDDLLGVSLEGGVGNLEQRGGDSGDGL